MNYRFFFGTIFLFFAHISYGQFFYTDYDEASIWTKMHNEYNKNNKSNNNWEKFYNNYLNTVQRTHDFGVFLKIDNDPNYNLIYKHYDLIGNGIISRYNFKKNNFEIHNSMFFTNDSLEALRGYVRSIKDLTMYTNQSFIKYETSENSKINYEIKLGRDFNKIGYGMGANLFLSNYSRPLDQFSIKIKYKNIGSLISVIELDTLDLNGDVFDRHLYLHTLSYTYKNLNVIFGESIIISGINSSLRLKYLNPFHLWSWENIGSAENGMNAFLFSGVSLKLNEINRLYAEILIDDINFHNKNAFFLNRYAYLIGFHKIAFPFKSSNIWFEFSSVLNQVYQSFHLSHTYVHNNFPIGHYLGNDFNLFRIHYAQIDKNSKIKYYFDFAYSKNGDNGIEKNFTTPWENFDGTLNKEYVPLEHPSNPLKKEIEFEIGIEINYDNKIYFISSIQSQVHSINNSTMKNVNGSLRFWTYLNFFKK